MELVTVRMLCVSPEVEKVLEAWVGHQVGSRWHVRTKTSKGDLQRPPWVCRAIRSQRSGFPLPSRYQGPGNILEDML